MKLVKSMNIALALLRRSQMNDMVNHPPHYTSHPSGIEQLEVTGHMNFCLGNAVKYIWRCDDKGKPIEDLQKAIFYLNWELKRRGHGESKEEGLRELNEREREACDAITDAYHWFETNYKETSVLDFKHILQHCAAWEDNRRAEGQG
jgi:hypothetical protein